MSGSRGRRCSVAAAGDSEDRSGTVFDRAWMAGGVHGEAAAWAKGTARPQHGLGLLREGNDLLVTEPEPDAGRVIAGAFLAGRALARDHNEHAAGLVVPPAHLTHHPPALA